MQIMRKRIKISPAGIAAIVIIALAVALRVVLTIAGWPPTNSDESTMGLMAIHIMTSKDFPIFLYGKPYMGGVEAYLGAALMHIFGQTLFALRLGDILLFTLALTSMYFLASLLYTQGDLIQPATPTINRGATRLTSFRQAARSKVALITIALLSIGSVMMLFTELMAHGGYPELLSLGTVAFLLAYYLAYTSNQDIPLYKQWRRLLAYGAWGLAVALAFWGDYIFISIILMTGLLLALFCWRELLKGAILVVLLGLLIGGIPLIIYNLHPTPGYSTLSVMWGLRNNFTDILVHSPYGHAALYYEVRGTLLESLPMATGAPPVCFDSNWVELGRGNTITRFECLDPHGQWGLMILSLIWSLGFLILWIISTVHELRMLWEIRRQQPFGKPLPRENRQMVIRHFARLALLMLAALTLLEFSVSPVAAVFSAAGRYLTALLISTPAIIAPLCGLARDREELGLRSGPHYEPSSNARDAFAPINALLRWGGLFFIGIVMLAGTVSIFLEFPTVQGVDQQQQALINDLVRIHATHFYTDFWTCNRLAFLSDEKLICTVVDDNLQGTHNGVPGYYATVKSDPNSAYLFLQGTEQANAANRLFAQSHPPYRRYIFEGYVVYQPARSATT